MIKTLCLMLFGVCALGFTLTGCQGEKPMDAANMTIKADSIYNTRMQAVTDSMTLDCNTNSSMWIQMKADSIYNAAVAAMPGK